MEKKIVWQFHTKLDTELHMIFNYVTKYIPKRTENMYVPPQIQAYV